MSGRVAAGTVSMSIIFRKGPAPPKGADEDADSWDSQDLSDLEGIENKNDNIHK